MRFLSSSLVSTFLDTKVFALKVPTYILNAFCNNEVITPLPLFLLPLLINHFLSSK